MQGSQEIKEQIDAVNHLTKLSKFVIEKDLYVTQAISIVSEISHDFYELIFQGGTSLAKSHRIIERMSEDCDFRMRFNDPGGLSKELKRKELRKFRHEIVDALKANGFTIEDSDVRVRNEGQFMGVRANYASIYPTTRGIKPFLALEFFLGEVKIAPVIKPVTTLVQQVLGDKVEHPEFPVSSVAIIETAAEKWVGLTRRVATSHHRRHYRDANLVRHMYDLFKINEQGMFFHDEFKKLVPRIVQDDRAHYKNHNDDYYQNPASEIRRAIDELSESTEWHTNWEQFVQSMVFAKQKPSYHEVVENLQCISQVALSSLEATTQSDPLKKAKPSKARASSSRKPLPE